MKCPVCGAELKHVDGEQYVCEVCEMKVTVKPYEELKYVFPWLFSKNSP